MRRPEQDGATGCSAIGEALGEPVAGSALKHRRLLCVEHTGPWPHGAAAENLPAELGARCEALGIRVQLIRRTQRPSAPERSTVLLGWADPDDRRAERVEVDHPDAAGDLDLERFAGEPHATGFGARVDDLVWLVCTHGTKDPCCAERGRPLVRALGAAGEDVWQTSHTGGDRFAANAIVLPAGLMLGRVPAARAKELAATLRDDRLPLDVLRGRMGWPQAVQAAETAVRRDRGLDGLHDVAVEDATEAGPGRFAVELTAGGERLRVEVEHRDDGRLRPTTCRDPAGKDPGAWHALAPNG